jgi:flavin reductase (DIM6/NTAB) family NADH-FMN oxidoreductase RutF
MLVGSSKSVDMYFSKVRIQNDWRRVLYANPVVLISTRSPHGIDNVAPYGMCMPISIEPPLFVVGVKPNRQTYSYIQQRQDFGVNFLTAELRDACRTAALTYPPDESEFDAARLTRQPAEEIDVALVKESPVNMECRLVWTKKAGDHDVVVGEIVATWIRQDLLNEDSLRMRMNVEGFYRIGDHYFRRGREI